MGHPVPFPKSTSEPMKFAHWHAVGVNPLVRRIPCFQESETKRGIVKNDFVRLEIQREARKGKEDSGYLT